MALQIVPAGSDEPGVRSEPAEQGARLVAEAFGEIPSPTEREYLREHIVLGYN
jgi:hypothetical protein